jgi:tRNA threonylcarbamoyl adenosine modification protein YeaZ
MLLAIDTSAGTSVAVVDLERGVLAEHNSSDTRRHAEVIGDLIAASLDDAKIAVTDVSGVVGGMGPGPFTGLRVGIAAARTFALGIGRPFVPVVSHDAVAYGATGPVVVATDSRRKEVYWSTYAGSDAVGLPERTSGPNLVKADALADAVEGFENYTLLEAPTVSAAALGLVAELQYANRRPFAANEPLYLRSPDVTISAGPKRVTA